MRFPNRQSRIHERWYAFEAEIAFLNVRVKLFSESQLIVDTGLRPVVDYQACLTGTHEQACMPHSEWQEKLACQAASLTPDENSIRHA